MITYIEQEYDQLYWRTLADKHEAKLDADADRAEQEREEDHELEEEDYKQSINR